MRIGEISRITKETSIDVKVNLDGAGRFTGTTGIGFLDHMINLTAVHGSFDFDLTMSGDLEIDTHHSVEDFGLALGEAFFQALGDKKGIARYGTFFCPMDETLARCVTDFSGRPYLVYDIPLTVERIGAFETEMLREFFYAFSVTAKCNLHIAILYGLNNHHMVEAAFKGWGHAMKQAVQINANTDTVLSTKGVL